MQGLPLNLDDLIRSRAVEDSRKEYKAAWNHPDQASIVRTISAFANDLLNENGGYVLIGIEQDESGRPILPPRGLGDQDLDELQKEIHGACKHIHPEYQPVVFLEEFEGRRIAILWAPGGDNRPYQAPDRRHGKPAYHVRVGPSTMEAKDELLRQLMERAARIPFDDRRNHNATLEDLSPSLVRSFLHDVRSDLAANHQAYSDAELFRLLKITARVNGHEVPRNFGLLFFSESPHVHFRCARTELAHIASDGDSLNERTFLGPLPRQIEHALQYLASMADVIDEKVAGQAQVDRTVAYPYEAMEEALVNAYYHRSYEDSVEPVKIYLYADRIEVISYPGPVPGIAAKALEAGEALSPVPARNRRIGELLKELRLAEGRGTGLPKIRRVMKANGSPEPRFDFDEDRTYFRVTLPIHPKHGMLRSLQETERSLASASPDKQALYWYHLANLRESLGEHASAIEEAYQRAIELLPSEPRFAESLESWKKRSRATTPTPE